jgi:hypothetical protein
MEADRPFAVVFTRPHEGGGTITAAELAGSFDDALEIAAGVRMNGGTDVALFERVPGELIMTSKLVKALPPPLTETAKALKKATRKAAKLPKSKKRSERILAATSRKIYEYVKAHPGKTVEEIGKAIKKETKDLKGPIRTMLDEKTLRKRGERRQTRYFIVVKRKRS